MSHDTQAMRDRLQAMRHEYQAQIDDLTIGEDQVTASDPGHAGDVSDDPADDADAMFAAEMNVSEANNLRGILDQVDSALQRLDEGTYGICPDCGKPIDEGRLATIPYAMYCLDDQIKHEQNPA